MGRLFKLKAWLTVADAARHLAIVFGEEVTEADVLRLALDGHLRLSVNFVNHAQAKCGKVVGYDEAEWGEFPAELAATLPSVPDEAKGKALPYMMSLKLDDKRYLNLGDEVTTIKEVWDLPMIGNERLDIEHAYQNLTGGPAVTLSCLDGAFVAREDGQFCQLQESYDENEYQSGSNAQLEKLKQHIADNSIGESEAEKLLNQQKEDRKKFLEKRKSQPSSENYYPAGGLPKDSVLVVRTDALRELEQSVSGAPANLDKPMTTTERNTLLVIIAALCDYSDIKHQERGVTGQIANMTAEIGAAITDDTIRKVLAKIPDALETRMK